MPGKTPNHDLSAMRCPAHLEDVDLFSPGAPEHWYEAYDILHAEAPVHRIPGEGFEPGTDAFIWRRSQYFWKHEAAIGIGNAVAVARSPRAPPTSSPVGSCISSLFGYLCRHPFFLAFSLAAFHLMVYT